MSRSNGPQVPPPAWPHGYPGDQFDPQAPGHSQAHNPAPNAQPGQQAARHPGFAPAQPGPLPQGQPYPAQSQPGQPSPGYAQPGYPATGQPNAGYPGSNFGNPAPAYQAPSNPGYPNPNYQIPDYPANGYPPQPGSPNTSGRPAPRTQPTASRAPQVGIPNTGPAGLQDPYAAQPKPQAPAPAMPDPRYGSLSGYDTPPTGRPQPAPAIQPPMSPPSAPGYGYGGQPAAPQAQAQPPSHPQYRADPPRLDAGRYEAPRTAAQQGWSAAEPQQPPIDPRGYDLGAYMPAPAADSSPQRGAAPPQWQPQFSDAPGDPTTGRPTTGRPADPQQSYQQFPAAQFQPIPGNTLPTQANAQVQDDDDYDDLEDDQPPRRPRYLLIAASLVMAIAAGGGLAYAYKVMFTPPTQIAQTPVVKGSSTPVRERPSNPGGAKFANSDSKMMDQLSDGGPRKVQSVVVGRDGSIPEPAVGQSVTASTSGPATVTPTVATAQPIPGMTVVLPPMRPAGGPPANVPPQAAAAAPPQAAAPARPAPPQASQPPPAAAPPVRPTRMAATAEPDPAATAAEAPKRPAPPPRKPATPPAGVGAGSGGFVAVLASVPATATSRVAALQQYADMQSKFGAVLAGKSPDVVEAQLTKGPYHRLVVGPPVSKEAALGVCAQLKAAGYAASCWVTAF